MRAALVAMIIASLALHAYAQNDTATVTIGPALSRARVCVAPASAARGCGPVLAGVTGADLSCVGAADAGGCVDLVAQGLAELAVLQDGADLYTAGAVAGLVPLVAESYGGATGAAYYAVAVVDKAFCDAPRPRGKTALQDLKGARSCHTGYRQTAGWTLPVGFLLSQRVMPAVRADAKVQPDAQSLAAFFNKTCAPRATRNGPLVGGGAWEGLCTGCKGDCAEGGAYGDEGGALRCLMEGNGDVAFVRDTTPIDYAANGPKAQAWSSKAPADLRLLCPAGGCAAVDSYESCSLARAPAYALVGTPAFRASQDGRDVAAALVAASREPAFLADAKAAGILTADTQALTPVDSDFDQYFGAAALSAYASMRQLASAAAGAPAGAAAPAAPASKAAAAAPAPGESLSSGVFVPMGPRGSGGGGGRARLSGGAVAGIIIAILAATGLAAAGGVWAVRRRRARAGHFTPFQDDLAATKTVQFSEIQSKNYSAPVERL